LDRRDALADAFSGEDQAMSSWSTVAMAVLLLGNEAVAQDLSARARDALAPSGKLRVALLPLPHMAVRDQATGQFTGVIVDLGQELAKRLAVPVEFKAASSNLAAVDQVRSGQADVTFLVSLPPLAAQIDFGPAYIAYETSFLVRADSPIRGLDGFDGAGQRIIVPEKSAIEARLSQTLKNTKLIGVPIAIGSAQRVVEMLNNGEADAYSNLTHLLSLTQMSLPGWRILRGSYMLTTFSVGYPKNRPAGAEYIGKFIEETKANGFIQKAIQRGKLEGAVVPN
jgi:polar amino acid transport system substrate-binding protein